MRFLTHVENGDYVRVVLPPPNDVHGQYSTRCAVSALHHGIADEDVEFYDLLAEAPQLEAVPNPDPVLPDPDHQMLLQTKIAVLSAAKLHDFPHPAISHFTGIGHDFAATQLNQKPNEGATSPIGMAVGAHGSTHLRE